MSLEEKIAALTVALDKNTAALLGQASKAADKAPAAASAAKPATAPKADAKKADAKKADAKKEISDDVLREKFGTYMAAPESKEDKEARKNDCRAIYDHFGVSRATEIKQENRAEALAAIELLSNGDRPAFMASDEDDGAAEDGELLLSLRGRRSPSEAPQSPRRPSRRRKRPADQRPPPDRQGIFG